MRRESWNSGPNAVDLRNFRDAANTPSFVQDLKISRMEEGRRKLWRGRSGRRAQTVRFRRNVSGRPYKRSIIRPAALQGGG